MMVSKRHHPLRRDRSLDRREEALFSRRASRRAPAYLAEAARVFFTSSFREEQDGTVRITAGE